MPDQEFRIKVSVPGASESAAQLAAVAVAETQVGTAAVAASTATAAVATSAAAIAPPANLSEIVRLLGTLVGQGRAAGASLDGVEGRLTAINSRLQATAGAPPPFKPVGAASGASAAPESSAPSAPWPSRASSSTPGPLRRRPKPRPRRPTPSWTAPRRCGTGSTPRTPPKNRPS